MLHRRDTILQSPQSCLIARKKGLWEWRKRVGADVANYVARTAAARGTKVHHMCEDYLNNVHVDWPEKWKEHERHFLAHCLFNQLKEKALCNINNIYAQEADCTVTSIKSLVELIVSQTTKVSYQSSTSKLPQKNAQMIGTKIITYKVPLTQRCLVSELADCGPSGYSCRYRGWHCSRVREE